MREMDMPAPHEAPSTNAENELATARTIAHVIYALHLLGFYTVLLPIAGIILNYIKIDDVRGTWLESHYRWQMRTFWFGLLWSLIALPFLLLPIIQYVVLIALIAWWIYRNIKGWIRLSENKKMYESSNAKQRVQSSSGH